MPDMLLRQVALVSESQQINPSDLATVSAALQKQATRDLTQFWEMQATVDSFPRLEDVPVGYWPIILKDNIDVAGAAGVHEDNQGQPFALVTADPDRDVWSLTCSHEMIEMLVDPFGNRLVASDSPKADQGRVQILVEPCDPSESAEFAYTINGILVSDFYSVHFFDPVAAPGVRYSFTGAIQEPRQVLRGGYLSWADPSTDIWWQETWFEGDQPSFRELGKLNAQDGSFRSQVDRVTAQARQVVQSTGIRAAKAAGLSLRQTRAAEEARAARLRRQIDALVGKGDGASGEARPTTPQRRRSVPRGFRAAPSLA
ncbi:MAG TPA: hypothetical protein VJ779_11280 [Acetobacteraceae bacterium]|nr:hypothetical protein [Acetobacteraceae bacterium]